MKKLEVRELLETRKLMERINEILRLIEEEGETIELTKRGKPIIRMTKIDESQESTEKKDNNAWERLRKIAEELAPYWPKDMDAVEVVRDIRRDL